jgi:dihydrofolate reductase
VSRLIFSILVTLDGFIDHTAMIADDELHDFSTAMLNRVQTVLFGRRTYQLFEQAWPPAKTDASLPQSMIDFANRIDEIDKLVFSTTLEQAGWRNSRLARQVDPQEIRRLKQEGDLVIAGASLARTFMNMDLIDEYQLLVNPIILGRGVPLFQDIRSRINLKLAGTRVFGSGVTVLDYLREH